jgi:hypothetical protein
MTGRARRHPVGARAGRLGDATSMESAYKKQKRQKSLWDGKIHAGRDVAGMRKVCQVCTCMWACAPCAHTHTHTYVHMLVGALTNVPVRVLFNDAEAATTAVPGNSPALGCLLRAQRATCVSACHHRAVRASALRRTGAARRTAWGHTPSNTHHPHSQSHTRHIRAQSYSWQAARQVDNRMPEKRGVPGRARARRGAPGHARPPQPRPALPGAASSAGHVRRHIHHVAGSPA